MNQSTSTSTHIKVADLGLVHLGREVVVTTAQVGVRGTLDGIHAEHDRIPMMELYTSAVEDAPGRLHMSLTVGGVQVMVTPHDGVEVLPVKTFGKSVHA